MRQGILKFLTNLSISVFFGSAGPPSYEGAPIVDVILDGSTFFENVINHTFRDLMFFGHSRNARPTDVLQYIQPPFFKIVRLFRYSHDII